MVAVRRELQTWATEWEQQSNMGKRIFAIGASLSSDRPAARVCEWLHEMVGLVEPEPSSHSDSAQQG
jgi:hypothetical protein